MKLSDMDKTDAWAPTAPLPRGWHEVEIDTADEGTSSGGYPQIELNMSNIDGSIRDWIVDAEGGSTRGKIKQLLEAAGVEIESGDWDFEPETLVGKKVRIHVGEKQKFNEPDKLVLYVMAYTPTGSGPVGTSDVPADESGMEADEKPLPF